MREYFYYLRDGLKRPVVTVCLLKLAEHTRKNGTVVVSGSGDVIVRGVAICSDSDDPCMKTGRNIAKGLALKAFVRRECSGLVKRDEAKKVLDSVIHSPLGSGYEEYYRYLGVELVERGKSVFDPVLSMGERNLTRDWIPTEAKS